MSCQNCRNYQTTSLPAWTSVEKTSMSTACTVPCKHWVVVSIKDLTQSPAVNVSNYLKRKQRLLKAGCSFTCEWNWFVKTWSLPILVNLVWALLFCTSMRATCPSKTSFCFLFCHSPREHFEEIVVFASTHSFCSSLLLQLWRQKKKNTIYVW